VRRAAGSEVCGVREFFVAAREEEALVVREVS
jgi:hypothetical protein